MTKSRGVFQCPECSALITRANKARHARRCPNKQQSAGTILDQISCQTGVRAPEKLRSLSPESQHISDDDLSFELNKTYTAQSAHPIAQDQQQDHLEETKQNEKQSMIGAQRDFRHFEQKPAKIEMKPVPQYIAQTLGPQSSLRMYPITQKISTQAAPMRNQSEPDIESSKVYSCLQFLNHLEINENLSILELDLHLEALASYPVLDYIQQCKPKMLLQRLKDTDAGLMRVNQLGGLILALVAYDDLNAIEILIQMLSRCKETNVDAAFNQIKTTLAGFIGSYDLAQWFVQHFKYVDDQALSVLRILRSSTMTNGATIMQCQRAFKCQLDQIPYYINLLQRSLAIPGQFVFLRQFIDESLTLYPQQPRISFDEFAKSMISLHDVQVDIGLGRNQIKNWVAVCAENGTIKAPRDDLQIQMMLQNFAKSNRIAQWVPISFFNTRIKGDLQSLIDKTGVTLTNEQLAVVTAALSSLNLQPKQHWELTAGTGKSFIIAAIAAVSIAQDASKRIEMIVPSEYLLNRDRKQFQQLWNIVGADRIAYHTTMSGGSKDNTLTIIDEADDLMLANPYNFFLNIGLRENVMMFSGSFKDSADSFLPKLFKHFKIQAWDCAFVQAYIRPPIFHEYVAAADLDDYITTERARNAVIIYIHEEKQSHYATFPQPVYLLKPSQDDPLQQINDAQYDFIQDINARRSIIQNSNQSDFSMNTTTIVQGSTIAMNQNNQAAANYVAGPQFTILIDQKVGQTYPLVIVTEQNYLRGIDIRAPRNGITFISTRCFSTQRAMQQALGRVGRFNDRCKRISVVGVPDFDTLGEQQSFGKIVQMASQLSTDQLKKDKNKRDVKRKNGFTAKDEKNQGKLTFKQQNSKKID